jgi:hypothetical protein
MIKLIKDIKEEFTKALAKEDKDILITEGQIKDEKADNKNLPCIAIYPDKSEMNSAPEQNSVTYKDTTKSINLPFRQKLFMDIYGKDIEETEKWSSLFMSLIMLEQKKIISAYNEKVEKEPHQSGDFRAWQTFEKIIPIKNISSYPGKISKVQIEFNITGRYMFAGIDKEKAYKIKEIKINEKEQKQDT